MNIATFPMVADSVGSSKAERTAHVCEAAQIGLEAEVTTTHVSVGRQTVHFIFSLLPCLEMRRLLRMSAPSTSSTPSFSATTAGRTCHSSKSFGRGTRTR